MTWVMSSNVLMFPIWRRQAWTRTVIMSAERYSGGWSKGLYISMNNPQEVVYSDDQVVIIKDKYPKAKHHLLVVPRRKINSLINVTRDDLDLLRHMQAQGEFIAEKANKDLRFCIGYHAIPSMQLLHLHVISQDLDSPFMKTKKHWNSFTTQYLVDSQTLIRTVEKNGQFQANAEEMKRALSQQLRCHVCRKPFKDIPSLKAHIVLHDVTKDTQISRPS